MTTRKLARDLAWFGIGLGLVEILAPRTLARAAVLHGRERLLRPLNAAPLRGQLQVRNG
jgi:hypothetical protein